jgi:RNA polymerase sigma-70 factor (ECF subfamily)
MGETAFEALFLEKRAALVRFFAARTGSPDEAEDLVQELYLKVRERPPQDVANAGAYLYRLGLNLMTDRFRSASRSRTRDDRYYQTQGGADPGTDAAPSPERATESRLRLEAMLRAIDQLPSQSRTVFRMHRIEGLSHQEVAQALGISKSTVEKHMMAALKRLTDALR